MKTSGLVHLYCGDGKGKTTAAVGLAVRHAGHGGKVVFAQFLKDGSSGECRVLAKLGVTVLAANPAGKFTFRMTDEEKAETAAALVRTFDAAAGYAVRDFLENRPDMLEVVLTGRSPSAGLTAHADYITEMQKRRHPYEKGVAAREGIEF